MRDRQHELNLARTESTNSSANRGQRRRKSARASLVEDRDVFSTCFEHAAIGLSVTDLDGRVLEANAAYCSLTGYTKAELRTIGLQTLVPPSDLLVALEKIRALITGETPALVIEQRYVKKDGSTAWVQNSVALVHDSGGRPAKIAWLTQDITERKRAEVSLSTLQDAAVDVSERKRAEQALRLSEERYRELFENSKDAFYVHDLSGIYVSLNRAAEKLSGYRREEIIGKHFSQFMRPEHARHMQRQLQRKLESTGETSYESEMITKKGRHVPVEISSRLIVERGVPVAVQECVRDISARKKAQEAARNYSRRLIEAQEAERRRISRELHDQVGQILTAVKMNLHALHHECTDARTLSSINDNLKVIDEAVDQVRGLSVDLRPLLLDDFGLVVALRWYLERQTRHFGIPAQFFSGSLNEDDRFSSELETACFRIVQEGVTNVVRHARASRISVRLERVLSDLILLITDDGAGFDARMLRSGNGTATLGLRGMEERVNAIGGTITIDSAPALGTEICARFPIRGEKRREPESSKALELAKA